MLVALQEYAKAMDFALEVGRSFKQQSLKAISPPIAVWHMLPFEVTHPLPGRICLQTWSRARVWCSVIGLVVKELLWWVKEAAIETGNL